MKGITGFETLVNKVKKAHRDNGYVRGLDGRHIFTRSEHSALNTLLQGAGAIVMKQALAIWHFERSVAMGATSSDFLTTNGWRYCANVHDEVQFETVPEMSEEVGKVFADCIREAGERLGIRCPLAGAYDIGDNWKDTH